MGKDMRKTDCPFCGNGILVEAEQGESNKILAEKAAMACRCPESRDWRIERKIRECLTNDLAQEDAVESILKMIELVRIDSFDSVTIKSGRKTYKIGKNAKGELKFKRNHSETEEQTL